MIIRRYIISEITKPAANILLLMVAIFASYTAIVYLTDAVGGLMTPAQVGILIGLRVGMALGKDLERLEGKTGSFLVVQPAYISHDRSLGG